MTFADWLAETGARVESDGMAGVCASAYELWIGALRRADRFADPGVNIYDRSWDTLVILDGCRADVLHGIAHEYEFLDTPSTHRSPGSTSYEWMERTFTEEYRKEMERTVQVTANPHSQRFFDDADFRKIDPVWRDAWDETRGTVLARSVTDRAIVAGREKVGTDDRLLVHYMQPHFPSVPAPLMNGVGLDDWLDGSEHAWQGLRRGEFTERDVWLAYVENLRYVLDDVAILLENLDAERVAITADHGNAKGEWGIYGHPNVPLNVLRNVPWFVTSATDHRTRDPDVDSTTDAEPSDETVAERLEALGYADEGT
ncbi:hypothetical protein [Halococcus thailandensis]|nr:hypothetical protein [Halococcus thailandensis]